MKVSALLCVAVAGALPGCHSLTEPPSGPRLLLASSGSAVAPTVVMTDLGTLGPGPGGTCSFPLSESLDINERGLIVGWSDSACAGAKGFMWDGGTMTSLGTFLPVAVNDHDQIAGFVGDAAAGGGIFPLGASRGFLLDHGVMTDLGTLGGDRTIVNAVNNHGQIVGSSATASSAMHGFLWVAGAMTDLGTLGGPSSEAIAVNATGQVAGNSATTSGATHAFLWQDGTITDLGTLGGDRSVVRALSDRGQIVGSSTTATGQTHAFLWQDGVMTDLGTLGGFASDAHAVNKRGQIAGSLLTANFETHIFVWQDGTMTDLGTPLPFGVLFRPLRMNDRGQIVAAIRFAGSLPGGRCYLWQDGTPIELGGVGNTVALNKHGQIVGWVFTPFDPFRHAVLWTLGGPDKEVVVADDAIQTELTHEPAVN